MYQINIIRFVWIAHVKQNWS